MVPVRLDTVFIEKILSSTIFQSGKSPVSVWGDQNGCNDLTISNPEVIVKDRALHIVLDANAVTGVNIGTTCVRLLSWQGKVDTVQQPLINDTAGKISFQTIDSNLLADDGTRAQVSSKIWDLVKDYVHPALGTVTIDFRNALSDLAFTLEHFILNDQSTREPIRLFLSEISTTPTGIQTDLIVNVSLAESASTPIVDESEFDPQKHQNLLQLWDQWDGFITFVVRALARQTITTEQRELLLDTLLDARYVIANVLSDGASSDISDNEIRLTFVQTWRRLAPVVRKISVRLEDAEALGFLSFIAANDALIAIDHLQSVTGWNITAQGLQRLAILLDAEFDHRNLETPDFVDPEYRQLFEFGEPLPLPERELQSPDEEEWPTSLLRWMLPYAVAKIANEEDFRELNRMKADRSNLEVYLPRVRDLLVDVSKSTLVSHPLESEYHTMFRQLILTTAWQETCWRQYQTGSGPRTPITSSAGALGLMQIMPVVWRGFYDRDSLANSIAYNAAAGGEILHRYLVRYALRKGEHRLEGGVDNLVKATYAAYNGGPKHLSRYRKSGTRGSLKQIDDSFWRKFEQIRGGDELAVISCY